MIPYAHSAKDQPPEKWQTLEEHSRNVAELAAQFAAPFGSSEAARLLGWVHDLGKATKAFQAYLVRSAAGLKVVRGEVKHAVHSGVCLKNLIDTNVMNTSVGEVLANIAMSHHGGLRDAIEDGERSVLTRIGGVSLDELDGDSKHLLENVDGNRAKDELLDVCKRGKTQFAFHLAVKFLYSCLVDADRCDAAGIHDDLPMPKWEEAIRRLEGRMATFVNRGRKIDKVRGKITHACEEAGKLRSQGVYTLSVPTGGGKTLSSLRFALEHAKKYRLKRVVYVIPYLSIIDQMSDELKKIFGNDVDQWVLEHHSGFDIPDDLDTMEEYKCLSERWDRPIILTTMVQFLETVVSNRASVLRKFHNMSEAVFVFDEIQALPVTCTYLFNSTVNFLAEQAGSTIVLCTATQPHLDKVDFQVQLSEGHSLVELSQDDLSAFKRTEIVDLTQKEMSVVELAEFAEKSVLAGESTLLVVNTKKVANDVYLAVKERNQVEAYVLTTNMCAQHRLDTLEKIRLRLEGESGETSFLCVSTQLIEAGVDVSFGCVIRALAGWTSIVQSAGRCNRHGECDGPKEVYVVKVAEKLNNLPDIAMGKEMSARVLNESKGQDLSSTTVMDCYCDYYFYRQKEKMGYPVEKLHTTIFNLLGKNDLGSQAYRNLHNGIKYPGLPSAFKTAAENFKVIEGQRIDVLVPYEDKEGKIPVYELIEQLKSTREIKDRRERYLTRVSIIRKLQRYAVPVFPNKEAEIATLAEKIEDMFYLVGANSYSETGFVTNAFQYL